MSTVNPHYTFHYSQPEAYHFSHDSVFLARRIFEELSQKDLSGYKALDICSGSGIVGLDLLFHLRSEGKSVPAQFDFLELQTEYQPHFEENIRRLGPIQTQFQFVNRNYDDLQTAEFVNQYDLIVSNPPYFFKWQGKQSPDQFKNRCKFFIDSDLDNLILGIAHSLKPSGSCYLLLRDLPEHKWSVLDSVRKTCLANPTHRLTLNLLGDVSGTLFVHFTKS